MEFVKEEEFLEWKTLPVTKKLFKKLESEREEMKEGLVNQSYFNDDIARGRCQAIALILDVQYTDLYESR